MICSPMQETGPDGDVTVEALTQRVVTLLRSIEEHEKRTGALRTENETLRREDDRLRAQLTAMLRKVFGRSRSRGNGPGAAPDRVPRRC
jgi:regulator of replication initiation timing